MMDQLEINYNNGILNIGDISALQNVMAKASKGDPITVGFIGGSITQGCLSSKPQTCYSYLVYEWWKNMFYDSSVTYVNAGIGGTTSEFGVARVDDDLLRYKPDFVVVEFSVNDEDNDHFEETYESLIRKLIKSESSPAILIVNSVRYDDGGNAQRIHNRIGKAYGIPCVSMRTTIYDSISKCQLKNSDVTTDNLHPNDWGHRLMANVIINFLDKIMRQSIKSDCKATLVEPLTFNAYEGSVRHQNYNSRPTLNGFEKDSIPQNDIREIFRNGWTSDRKGSTIKFEVECSCIAAQYRKSVIQPTPIAKAIVDGDEENAIILDGNFEQTWGDSIHITTLAKHLSKGKHTVEIKIETTHDDDKVPFYLVSIITA